MNFRKVNNLAGWITGGIATLVYLLTMEPTVSFWDCGEFISCAYKIEVGHSPGAPLFMLIQRFFALFAGGNVQKVALMMNAWSALASGLTILFLFWTITHFAKRLLVGNREDEPDSKQTILIIGAGLIGGLAYTFSDTFWFSAVEAEVYATSSFFTAIVFWAILKWEHVADNKYADRWLILISYLMGLSVGIHLLNLLTIPAVAMVYYFRRYKVTTGGAIGAFFIGCALLALVQFGVLQGLPILASKFDLFFVNDLHMPFDSGALVFIILFVALLIVAIILAKKKGKYLLHTGLLCITFIIIGFISYLAPLIRSRADVPIDMTNPDNAISLVSYIQREQFGSQPLFFGPYFNTKPIGFEKTGDKYARSTKDGKDFYEVVGDKSEPEFPEGSIKFFPRIWEFNEARHVNYYRSYLNLSENEEPTSADNMKFFFGYHLDWMWWRYFMWNYSGRQNDFQGHGDAKSGNWITGIKPIDKYFLGLGDMSKMGDGYKDNPARNQLYMLPFILGILGIVYQFKRNSRDFVVTLMLFFFTGIAIAIYLNMPPLQPRERDYAFAGSTYAYAIWIGLGVLMVNQFFKKAIKGAGSAYAAIALCLLAVPALMAAENWDDHDRSNKYLARSTAYNALMSCDSNAILFTYGDNDTYPLWYLQEVEGVRKDIRIINMSLLGIDWYIEQLNHRSNDAMPVPMIWNREDYIGDRRNYIRYYPAPQINQNGFYDLKKICEFMISKDSRAKLPQINENYMPTKNFTVPTPSMDELISRGLLKAEDSATYTNEMYFTFPKDMALKDDLAALNMLASIAEEGWNRPMYFNGGLPGDNYLGLEDYMQLEGLVYRLMPFKKKEKTPSMMGEMGFVNLDKSYNLFMNEYKWGNSDRHDVYFDEKNRIMFYAYRLNVARIAIDLVEQGKNKEAIAILDKVVEGITEDSYYYDFTAYVLSMAYYRAGDKEKGRTVAMKTAKNAEDDIRYTITLSEGRQAQLASETKRNLSIIGSLSGFAQSAGDTKTAQELEQKAQALASFVPR